MSRKRSLNLVFGMLILSLFICLIAVGCKKEDASSSSSAPSSAGHKPAPGEAAALVNGQKILRGDLEAIVSMYSSSGGGAGGMHGDNQMSEEMINELRQKILNQMIEEELLYQESKGAEKDLVEAVNQEYDNIIKQYGTEETFVEEISKNNLTVEKVKEQLRKKLAIKDYIDNELMTKIDISEETKKKFYDDNKTRFNVAEQVKASHILADFPQGATQEQKDEALKKIKDVQKRLKKGEKFEDLAKEVSACPSGKNGGDLGFFTKDKMVKPFSDAAFSSKVGDMTDIVETQFGYHIIKVVEKKDAQTRSYDEVKESIENNLKREQFQSQITNLITELKEKAKIEIVN